jgi:hypothetical protein
MREAHKTMVPIKLDSLMIFCVNNQGKCGNFRTAGASEGISKQGTPKPFLAMAFIYR